MAVAMFYSSTVSLILFVNLVLVIGSDNSTICNRLCGDGKSAKKVNYPFGFSDGCEIRLNCSAGDGKIFIEEFEVRNLTSDSIMVDLPSNCTRPLKKIKKLFGKNYGPTTQNGLLLKSCSSLLTGCIVPASLVENRFDSRGCGMDGNTSNMSCYAEAEENGGIGILSYRNINRTGCKYLFSSTFVASGKDGSDASLEFHEVQLEWWVLGPCNCSDNAECLVVQYGHRCMCKEGFTGDGFIAGVGCQKVSSCDSSKYIRGHCGRAKAAVLTGGIVAVVAAVGILAAICYCMRRHSSSSKSTTSAKRLLSEAAGNSSVALYPYKEIERATNGFHEKHRLGHGAYGTVYAGRIHDDEWVAIKKIKHRDTNGIEQVMNEIKLLSSVSHRNLVRLLGCCIENGEQILVYEYMPNGTLSQHLQRERGTGLPWTTRLTIATETAQAIAYLHSAVNPPIYHRDIKSSNILLDFNYRSKVADFGLSRLGMTESSHISTAPQGTPGYVDPQYHQNFHLSDKSDVYSFGVVLVEIITAMKVVDFSRSHTDVNLAALAVDRIGKGLVDEIIDPFIEPHRDAWTLSSVYKVAELAFRCLAYHKDMRPSMTEVADELQQIRLSGWASMEENICMESLVASSCSSPFNGSERSLSGVSLKKGVTSRRLVVTPKGFEQLGSLEESKDSSPVSVHDPWFSEHSSPSANSLLGNVTR